MYLNSCLILQFNIILFLRRSATSADVDHRIQSKTNKNNIDVIEAVTYHFRDVQNNVCENYIYVRNSYLALVGNVLKSIFDFAVLYYPFTFLSETWAYVVHRI